MDEIWIIIEDFPNYRVSNYGRVVNEDTGRVIKQNVVKGGGVKVGLRRAGIQHSKLVKLLVAEAFVPKIQEEFNTPIHLDNDQSNNHADNLAWRPRWFAHRYSRQIVALPKEAYNGPIYDVDNDIVYKTVFHAAQDNGLLVVEIWRAIVNQRRAYPTSQLFILASEM